MKMPIQGQVLQHHRVDIRNAPEADGATVLFLYSGVVAFDFRSPDEHTFRDKLIFEVPDSDLDESQIAGGFLRLGVSVVPMSFRADPGAPCFIDVENPEAVSQDSGRGIRVRADLAVQNGGLSRVAYQFAVHAIL
jgi:hypothetical protein